MPAATALSETEPAKTPIASLGQSGVALRLPPQSKYFIVPRMGMLCYGDNLDILRRYLEDKTVDSVRST